MSAKVPYARVSEILRTADPAWAQEAEAAWDWITASGDLDEIDLHAIQMFVWYELPAKWSGPGVRIRLVAESLAKLLDALELPGYAEVSRSEATRSVLAAWERSRSAGHAALNRALGTSGVEAPDLDDFQWGDYMGIEEARLRLEVSSALEEAVESGQLIVGSRGWREAQRQVARAFLTTPRIGLGGKTPLQAIREERLNSWLTNVRGDKRRELIAPIAALIQEPIDPPRGGADGLRPLLRLLELASEGIPLTEKKNISPAIVRELTEEFGWWKEWLGTPRSEQDVVPLVDLHQLARSAKLVRHSTRKMLLTPEGRRAADDPERCWRIVVHHLARGERFTGALAEVVFAVLVPGPTDLDSLERLLHEALEEAGWRVRGSAGLDPRAVASWMWDLLWPAKVLGFIRVGKHPDRAVGLTEVGHPTALAVLRERAVGPRISL